MDAKILNIQFVIHTILITIKLLRTPTLPVLMSLEAMQRRKRRVYTSTGDQLYFDGRPTIVQWATNYRGYTQESLQAL